MDETRAKILRALPSVSSATQRDAFLQIAEEFGDGLAKLELRSLIAETRQQVMLGALSQVPETHDLIAALTHRLERITKPMGRRAINASGILLHTGLGRAPMCPEAIEALSCFDRYSILQTDIAGGKRSRRDDKIERMLVHLTGCEAATVVNNNAAATMLILNTCAPGAEVIISRGQLVEIGGSFRIPDVMACSSAILREVGTTNRTHLRDYEAAIGPSAGAIMHVHTSNYRVRGFASVPTIGELAELGHRHDLPVIDDLGSGALVSLRDYGLPDEPLVRDSVRAGADVVCFSGDKLISGPQAGIILGRRELIDRVRKNPFARMFRVCKMTLAALEATLTHFVDGASYKRAIPFYRMLARPVDELASQAESLIARVGPLPDTALSISDDLAFVGSGSIPDEGVATKVVRVVSQVVSPQTLAHRLRGGIPSVFPRIHDGAVLLDMRTIRPDEVDVLAAAVRRVCIET
jgi:L-seryl-tRNA(Ser) seleniumtransferase